MQTSNNQIKGKGQPVAKPHKENFPKVESERAVGIMKHKDGRIEKRKF